MREFLEARNKAMLGAYSQLPSLVREHHGIEQTVLAGGYGYRQILELVQNGADAILEANQGQSPPTSKNRVHVLISASHLYVANTGAALSEEGLEALLSSHRSPKRGNQIGRFGLGFKSLLRLGGCIDLFTRASGAIRFDPERCRRELMNAFKMAEAPGLRLAWPLPASERLADTLLEQFAWAETVVRVEVRDDALRDHLGAEVRAFPAEFLLFFPIATTLVLDEGKEPARALNVEPRGDEYLLHDGEELSRWRVTHREVTITYAGALADATHIHARESVPMSWAIPLAGRREEAGRFWAFFPTHTPTYVPGILNAPWKLNSDRNAIIAGEWNSALMAASAQLVAETLPGLASPDDPGRALDAFPRQPERKDEDAAPFLEALWARLEEAAVISDAAGFLRKARELRRPPRDSVELAETWQVLAKPEELARMVHATCLVRQRASRLKALEERLVARVENQQVSTDLNLRVWDAAPWFAAVASNAVPTAIKVLELAKAYADDCKPGDWSTIRPLLSIIPSEMGELLPAPSVLIAPEGTIVPGRATVAFALYNDEGARRILTDVMKVQVPDESVWEQVLNEAMRSIPQYPREARATGWTSFWSRLRQAPAGIRDRFVKLHQGQIRIRRRDGTWVARDEALLPGILIDADDASANQGVLVDAEQHQNDQASLEILGIGDVPSGVTQSASYADIAGDCRDLSSWIEAARVKYRSELDRRQNPQEWYLQPLSLSMPIGWKLLSRLVGAANTRLTAIVRSQIKSKVEFVSVQFGHLSRRDAYPVVSMPHPVLWLLLAHGSVQFGNSIVRLAAVAARRNESVISRLPATVEWSTILDELQQAIPRVQPSKADIRDLWLALIEALANPNALAGDALADLWAAAARDGVIPATLPSLQGPRALSEIFVCNSPDLARRARVSDRIVVTLDGPTLKHWIDGGAQSLSKMLEPVWDSTVGAVQLLTAAVPELADVLRGEEQDKARCQPVSGLRLKLGEAADPVACLMWQGTLLLDMARLPTYSRAERLRLVLEEIAPAGWLDGTAQEAMQRLGDARVDGLRAEVAQGASLEERLLRAVGKRREPLLGALGTLQDMSFIQQCTPIRLASLTLAQLGPATLTTLKDALSAEGLKPPERWNSAEARAFVAAIGFPAEFASAPEAKRDAEESISGPIELPPLHDFQREVMQGIGALLTNGTKRRRAVVSLPTGGGKTRVTVEAAVRLVLAPKGTSRCVLWVAQTDELCEQAVQAFRQVWVNLGAQQTDLRIVRLWGGNPNPAMQALDRPVVLVASIQTLNSRIGGEGLAWLSQPGLVVVDECHHAITPSYSNLLRWLDAEAPRPGATPKDEPPIVGLSATPFRTDDDESQRLARRFDSLWLPADQAALHDRLRAQGVLAQAIYEALQSGATLLGDEIERLARLPEPWEGLDFENLLEAINQRLAGDAKRNERLVEYIRQCSDRSILFFTNSVQHAEEMSARLNLADVPAAAVSGNTPTVARRYFLDRFQRGELRVLSNHSVLATGFDAPKTDMVLIARQVFSPVRYMQMVGRGLRGEKNGGTARCRIVTVLDNLGRFSDKHPYHFCSRYFDNVVRRD